MRITLAYDNTVHEQNDHNQSVHSDWGFAAVVESDDQTILFDTGARGTLLLENLHALGFDPSTIDSLVLSHHHHDHVGGIRALLDTGARPRVYFPASFPRRLTTAIENATEAVPVADMQTVAAGIFSVVISQPARLAGRPFDEQALAVTTTDGIVLITGCAHPGILSMTKEVQTRLSARGNGQEIPSARGFALVMGGFHLMKMSRRRFSRVVVEFQSLGVQGVMPAHCTGRRQIAWFAEAYGDRFVTGGVGRTVSFKLDPAA